MKKVNDSFGDAESKPRASLIARINRIRSRVRQIDDETARLISDFLFGLEKALAVDVHEVSVNRHIDVIVGVLQDQDEPLSAAQIKRILEDQRWLIHATDHVRRAAVNGGLDRAVKRGLITSQGSVKSRRFAILHSD